MRHGGPPYAMATRPNEKIALFSPFFWPDRHEQGFGSANELPLNRMKQLQQWLSMLLLINPPLNLPSIAPN